MGKVYKTFCTVIRAGKTVGTFYADTIFIKSIPHVVFEWESQPDGTEKPCHIVALDTKYFVPLQGWDNATYLYQLPVVDPRTVD